MKLLWVGDAIIKSGFGRVTHNLVPRLIDLGWDITVLGVCYDGDPHPYSYPIYPAGTRGDIYGIGRLSDVYHRTQPDACLFLQDPWIVPHYLPLVSGPTVASMPVDAPNLPRSAAFALARLSSAIFWTRFALTEAHQAGFSGRATVIPFGVDPSIYFPTARAEARAKLGIPLGDFVVGNVNTNHARKRLDLTVMYFAEWVQRYKLPPSVRLFIHAAPRDSSVDLVQLADYYGVRSRMIVAEQAGHVPEELMRYVYAAMDVQVSTTLGEGFGLPTIEAMACGIPQIVPAWAALGDWAADAVWAIPVTSYQVTPGLNTIGGIADREQFIAGLHGMYTNDSFRIDFAERALARAKEPQFQWDVIAEQYHRVLSGV